MDSRAPALTVAGRGGAPADAEGAQKSIVCTSTVNDSELSVPTA
jgi:hypothetical protein